MSILKYAIIFLTAIVVGIILYFIRKRKIGK